MCWEILPEASEVRGRSPGGLAVFIVHCPEPDRKHWLGWIHLQQGAPSWHPAPFSPLRGQLPGTGGFSGGSPLRGQQPPAERLWLPSAVSLGAQGPA